MDGNDTTTRRTVLRSLAALTGIGVGSSLLSSRSDTVPTRARADSHNGGRVDSVNDTDGTTPLDAQLTVPSPQSYQTYTVVGYVWGSRYSRGEGGETNLSITINDYTESVYDYTLMSQGNPSYGENEAQWIDQVWRRYKTPINYTISADSDPVSESDGNDSMFTTISNNAHRARRGLMGGRMGGRWVQGGHPFGPVESIEITSTDDMEGKLVCYGMDWKADL